MTTILLIASIAFNLIYFLFTLEYLRKIDKKL